MNPQPWFDKIAMRAQVVDASALAAVLFAEPQADQVCAQLGDTLMVAPALIEYELGNVCLQKSRRHPQLASALTEALGALQLLNLQLHDIDRKAVLAVARSADLSYYDASYLWLARELDIPLLSLDKRLAAALRQR